MFDGCCVKFLFLCGGWCDARRLDTHNFTLLLFLLLSRRAVLVDLTGTEITSRVLPHMERRPLRLDRAAGDGEISITYLIGWLTTSDWLGSRYFADSRYSLF